MTAIDVPRQPKTIEPGQRWTFVDTDGKQTEYVVGNPMDDDFMSQTLRNRYAARWEDQDHPQNIVYLLNEATGKYAMVTRYWLRGLATNGCHWLPPEVADA